MRGLSSPPGVLIMTLVGSRLFSASSALRRFKMAVKSTGVPFASTPSFHWPSLPSFPLTPSCPLRPALPSFPFSFSGQRDQSAPVCSPCDRLWRLAALASALSEQPASALPRTASSSCIAVRLRPFSVGEGSERPPPEGSGLDAAAIREFHYDRRSTGDARPFLSSILHESKVGDA